MEIRPNTIILEDPAEMQTLDTRSPAISRREFTLGGERCPTRRYQELLAEYKDIDAHEVGKILADAVLPYWGVPVPDRIRQKELGDMMDRLVHMATQVLLQDIKDDFTQPGAPGAPPHV